MIRQSDIHTHKKQYNDAHNLPIIFYTVHFLTARYGNTTFLSILLLFLGIHLFASPSRKGG